ncbi:hypothetical protein HB364_04680 [Pseudoflavitalea sp. X16]|uniref:hypothetical protein n=1 Tax=Paraflavitalea devenefica TaxID=2716334 RepID=UPI00141FB853|nr:hypothetical protein [Paraflavitalea devenefica]NII24358.1 hypothetical protein [Paraflavitalea devenefica]
MKSVVYALVLAALSLAGCKKDGAPAPSKPVKPQPEMIYTDLQNRELKFQQAQVIDLNKDGAADIGFSTWYIGDPVEREDEVLFFAGSYIHSLLLVDDANGSPAFKSGDVIPVSNYPGHTWYQVAQVEMAMKNTPESGQPYWEGAWKQVSHQYLAIQVVKEGKRYNGWIEVSFDTAGEKLILHKAAICKEAEKAVVAGK